MVLQIRSDHRNLRFVDQDDLRRLLHENFPGLFFFKTKMASTELNLKIYCRTVTVKPHEHISTVPMRENEIVL